ncbi:hypothetical protein N0V82_001917 [Gnomoniopsis sp. IMI 355080]|nr:hypothetical protein N0V82_001917 [Gnomoniopsis sp. IMI 355080]
MTSSQRPKAPQLTHFLCFALVTPASQPQLSASIASFKDHVIRPTQLGGFGLPPDAVRPVGTLHLTLGMMSFPKNEGLERAIAVLKSLKPREILAAIKRPAMPGSLEASAVTEENAPSSFSITLMGLNSMQKPDKATVLYAPPLDPNGTLQNFAEKIKATFQDAGLLLPENRPLLLHATIVNTTYVKKDRRKGQRRDRIIIKDTQAIIDRYEDQVWIEAMSLDKIAICRMSAKPVEQNGAVVDAKYEVEAEIDV